ncbi:MAG: hypothetical protein KAS66_08215 [Candidatus Omnitrophica bacterium]|nr:hypothetical protein [Candidatus Omnitrophota bacterium]
MTTLAEYVSLFIFRGDTFAEQQKDGSYKRIFRRLTSEDLLDHIKNHTRVLALYPSVDGRCSLGAIDLDIPHGSTDDTEAWVELENMIKSVKDQLNFLGISKPILVERTGGRGYHIWVFSEEMPVWMMHDFLKKVTDSLGLDVEIFPIDTVDKGLGRGIRPPLGTHLLYPGSRSFFVDDDFREHIITSNEIEDIDNHKITIDNMEKLGISIDDNVVRDTYDLEYADIPKVTSFAEVYDDIRPCFQRVYDEHIETTGGDGWNFMTAAAAEIMANGGRDKDVHTYFSVQEQYVKKTTAKHLRPIKRKSLRPFTCEKLMERCGKYVGEYCDDCRVHKQERIYEDLEKAVDFSQGKEERIIGGVEETIEQFKYVAKGMEDILTHEKYTVILNGFNKGKTWGSIAMMQNIIGYGGRVNFLAHTKKVKEIIIQRLLKAGVGFLDNPSNLELCSPDVCPHGKEFLSLGYVPSIVCKECPKNATIGKLIKPIMDDYITGNLPFFGNLSKYRSMAEEYDTCPKWIYLALVMATVEENLVIITTDAKIRHHLFIPGSPLIQILKSGTLFCTIIDQIDFINRKIPKITISEKKMMKNMRLLGLIHTNELEFRIERIGEAFLNGDITPESIEEMRAADELKQWIYLEGQYESGHLRRIYNVRHPDVKTYDYISTTPMRIVMNDIFGKRINPRLYDKTIAYMRDLRVECANQDHNMSPMNFREIMETLSNNSSILGITSTPTDIETSSSQWWATNHDSKKGILDNLYEIPIGTDIINGEEIDGRTIIYSRKSENDYINDGEVRGNSGGGGKKDAVTIESLQYPKSSEEIISDLVQMAGGNIGKGTKTFYQGIVADAVTQAAKYDADKIYIPNPEIFTALGFRVDKDNLLSIKVWEDRVAEKFIKNNDGLYRHKLKTVPDEIINLMLERGYLKMRGKKYLLGEA